MTQSTDETKETWSDKTDEVRTELATLDPWTPNHDAVASALLKKVAVIVQHGLLYGTLTGENISTSKDWNGFTESGQYNMADGTVLWIRLVTPKAKP